MKLRNALALLGVVAICGACSSWPSEEKPITSRLDTVPSGAQVYVKRLSIGPLTTPVDLPRRVRRADTITVMLAGYQTWEGQLSQAWQPADKTHRVVLKRKE